LCCVQVLLLQRQLGEALAELQISRERLAEAQAVQVGGTVHVQGCIRAYLL
jgi:hypothetical protein